MADNTTLDPGTGGDTIRDKDRAGIKTPIVAIDLNPAGSETLMSGAMPVTNTGTFAVQPAANSSVNVAQMAGTTTDTNSGLKSAGTQRVVLATDQPQLTNALKVDGSAVTQPVSAATLPLPTGAATSAKQPALGTAGAASADVLTVQGVASMTALKVDGSGVTQPVSGTVTATGPLTDTQLRANADPVSISTAPSTDVTNVGTFAVQDSQKLVDNAGFTDGTTPVNPVGYIFDEVAGTALTENDVAAARVDSKRAQVLVIEDATTRGRRATVSAAGAVQVDASGVAVPITDNSGSLTVDSPQLPAALVSGRLDVNVGAATTLAVAVSSGSVTLSGGATSLQNNATASSGWTPQKYVAQTTTVQTVKGTGGCIAGYMVYNPNTSVAYLQIFNVATATTVTLGTTVPDIVIPIPPGSAANVFTDVGIGMTLGIKLACTTTATGSTAPTTGLDMTIFYK